MLAREVAEVRNLSSQLAHSKAEFQQLSSDLNETERRVRDLELYLNGTQADHVEDWVNALPHQKALTCTMGVLAALSIVGPSSYTRPFLALSGSAVGGLLIASVAIVAYGDFTGDKHDTMWLDAMLTLLRGSGDTSWYCVWAVVVLIGAIRLCLRIDKRPHDVHWPSSWRCCRGRASPPPPPPPERAQVREDSMRTNQPFEARAPGGVGFATPSTQAPRDNTPVFSMASQSPSRLPPLAPPPPVMRR
uniref:Uncharacterized protein n=1 Tax=Alexandrium catenella TaxID=2925 RepID=A0A7S1PXL6_ALECA